MAKLLPLCALCATLSLPVAAAERPSQVAGAYQRAMSALESARSEVEPGSLEEAEVLNHMAMVQQTSGAYHESERSYKAAIRLCRRLGAPALDALAKALNDLGSLRLETGRPSAAKEHLLEALEIRRRLGGPKATTLAPLLSNLGTATLNSGDRVGAERFYLRSLEISRKYGRQVDMANTQNNLGTLRFDQERYEEAILQFEGALDSLRAALGPRHPSVGRVLISLTAALIECGRLEDAEGAALEARSILERTLPPTHPALGILLENYAVLLKKTGRKKDARQAKKRAARIAKANREENLLDHTIDVSALTSQR